ncbi:MAG: LamG domain-containing protein [Pirellulales bacterium]
MAQQCLNASNQYFTFPALNVTVPPVTFSLWINTAAIVAKDTALFCWRGAVNTAVFLLYIAPNWELRYFVGGGTQWQTATALAVSTGVWQHVCVAISSSQARLYLDGSSFTNNTSHSSANINETGNLARDPFVSPSHTSFSGSIAEAAVWTAALPDAECRALGKRFSPLCLQHRLHDLVFYKDLIRDDNRGVGPALTAVNSPSVAAHPPQIHPHSRMNARSKPAHFLSPFRLSKAAADASRMMAGGAALRGAASGVIHPIGEVSS